MTKEKKSKNKYFNLIFQYLIFIFFYFFYLVNIDFVSNNDIYNGF